MWWSKQNNKWAFFTLECCAKPQNTCFRNVLSLFYLIPFHITSNKTQELAIIYEENFVLC